MFPIAAASRPPKAPASVVELKKNEYLFCASCLRYHLEVISIPKDEIKQAAIRTFQSGKSIPGLRGFGAVRTCLVRVSKPRMILTHSRLEDTQEEPSGQQSRVVLHKTLPELILVSRCLRQVLHPRERSHDRCKAEEEHVGRQPDMRFEALQQKVARDFE